MSVKKNRGIEFLLSSTFFLLTMIPLLISCVIGFVAGYTLHVDSVRRNQYAINHIAVDGVSGFIQEKYRILETIADLVDPQSVMSGERQRILGRLLGSQSAFRQIILFDNHGRELHDVSRLSRFNTNRISDSPDKSLFTQALLKKMYVSPVFFDSISREPLVNMAVPVIDVFGEVNGVLAVNFNLKFMWELIDELNKDRWEQVYVIDREGVLIAYHDLSRVLRRENMKAIRAVGEFLKMNGSPGDAQYRNYRGISGEMVLGTCSWLEEPEWVVISEVPLSKAFGRFYLVIILTFLFIFIVGGFSVRVGYYHSRRITKPILNLVATADNIAGGKTELSADVEGPDEIARLAVSFNSMTCQLRSMIRQLEERSQYLHNAVSEYVDYMALVGAGNLDIRLEIPVPENDPSSPLVTLGLQLNHTTCSLREMIEQINRSSASLEKKERELEEYSEKLKKSNVELEQFAFTASHDLQEPLRKIRFYGEQLSQNYADALDKKAGEYLLRMNKAVIRMENFIRDLLQFSRVASHTDSFRKTNLNTILTEVKDEIEVRIRETGAAIEIEKLPEIEADPLQMKQLFQNLLSNSLKYRREDVQPLIKITCRIYKDESPPVCCMTVADNGIGINPAHSVEIFGLFKRLHGRNKYNGTGIGLAICKKIVERHKGTIAATGKENEGTIFTITLPLRQTF